MTHYLSKIILIIHNSNFQILIPKKISLSLNFLYVLFYLFASFTFEVKLTVFINYTVQCKYLFSSICCYFLFIYHLEFYACSNQRVTFLLSFCHSLFEKQKCHKQYQTHSYISITFKNIQFGRITYAFILLASLHTP